MEFALRLNPPAFLPRHTALSLPVMLHRQPQEEIEMSSDSEPTQQHQQEGLLQDPPTPPTHKDPDLIHRFHTLLRSDLEKTSEKMMRSISREIEELGQRTDTLENKTDDAITVLDRHKAEIHKLTTQVSDLKEKLEDLENRSRRCHLRIRGLPETYKNLDQDITELFQSIAPDIPPPRMEMDRVHRSLGKPPQSGLQRNIIELLLRAAREAGQITYQDHSIQIFTDLAPQTIQKRRTFKPALTIVQQANIRYRWGLPFRLLFTYKGRQYSPASYDDAWETLQRIQLVPQDQPSPIPSQSSSGSPALTPIW
uniref:L1 transposable element RRM domain-containing protein n=1 Tax=Xenopus tropicalis TaxID=8364 RepID=A0A1B8XXT6_XENTR